MVPTSLHGNCTISQRPPPRRAFRFPPACASNRQLIERLQTTTGHLIVVSGGKPRLSERKAPQLTPFDPSDGGFAA